MLSLSNVLTLRHRALALGAQSDSTDKYSDTTVSVMLSLGNILESLLYRLMFSTVNCLAWLAFRHKPMASSQIGHMVKNLFSGVGIIYTTGLMAWALLLSTTALLTVPRVRGISLIDVATVWAFERLHTWTWQFGIVSTAVFTTGRRRELFENQLRCAAVKIVPEEDDNDSVAADDDAVKQHTGISECITSVDPTASARKKEKRLSWTSASRLVRIPEDPCSSLSWNELKHLEKT